MIRSYSCGLGLSGLVLRLSLRQSFPLRAEMLFGNRQQLADGGPGPAGAASWEDTLGSAAHMHHVRRLQEDRTEDCDGISGGLTGRQ